MTTASPETLLPVGRIQIAVIARAAGRLIAREGAVLFCGGLGGAMEAACR